MMFSPVLSNLSCELWLFHFFSPDPISLTHNYLKHLFLQYVRYNYVNAVMFMVLAGAVSKEKQSYCRHHVST